MEITINEVNGYKHYTSLVFIAVIPWLFYWLYIHTKPAWKQIPAAHVLLCSDDNEHLKLLFHICALDVLAEDLWWQLGFIVFVRQHEFLYIYLNAFSFI